MVKYNTAQLNQIYSALSDQTRRGIIVSLTNQTQSAQKLAAPYEMSLPAISKHLKVLEKAKLVRREIKGRTHLFSLDVKTLQKASDWLIFHQQFWQQSLSKLEGFLKTNN
ncbi:MAG: metalloregulator ArsR/SmtB family transcription factor [Proteobacteria bacterium]|nr:metalloregulator ArsR/SmtB family transcription factor [Pseudomonadota bacterium]